VILVDTGPLVAILDRNDSNHAKCVQAAADLPADRLVTSWPCFTEAMYLVGRRTGVAGQEALWGMVSDGFLKMWGIQTEQIPRMAELMRQYQDLPMDLADASLVAIAEDTGHHRVFTLDSHFRVYRFIDGSVFDVAP
jgi:hypothetical protein